MAKIEIEPKAISETEYRLSCDSHSGYCVLCRDFTGYGCEPDARRYVCPDCEHKSVFGTEEALIHGYLTIKPE